MRVGILSQWFPPETGPASIPGVLARGLVERGHSVTVVTGFPNYPTGELYEGYRMSPRSDSTELGYSLRRVAVYPDHSPSVRGRLLNYGSFAASAALVGIPALRNIDVLWVYNSPATVALPMWLAKWRSSAPIVLHNMDMWPDSVLHTGFAPKFGARTVLRGLDSWVNTMYRSAALVAYITPSAGAELQRRGVPDSKLRYAPVWIDEKVYRPASAEDLRSSLGFTSDEVVIGYAGALGQAQGVTRLISAVLTLAPEVPVRCLILGSGTEEDEIAALAKQNPDRVTYRGVVPQSEMTAFGAVPDIGYVGLAPGAEGLLAAPSKVHAIMAASKPILASASGDAAALIHRSRAGFTVSPDDTRGLIDAIGKAAVLGRSGLADIGKKARDYHLEHFSEDRGLNRITELLEEATEVAPGGRS